MNSNVFVINKKGLSHTLCEDSVYIDRSNGVYVVCDGVSNSLYGGVGAKELSESIGRILAMPKTKKYLAQKSPQEIRKVICAQIQKCTQSTMASLSCSANDVASTLIAVSVYEDVLTIIHAGDGAVFAAPEVYQNEVPLIVSYPDNDAEQRVFPAASPRQLERMRVIHLKTSDIKCLALGTDGFTDRYIRPETMGFDGYSLNAVFQLNSVEELASLIENNHLSRPAITDDISAVIIKFENGIAYTGKAVAAPTETTEKTLKTTPAEKEQRTELTGQKDKPALNEESPKKVSKTAVRVLAAIFAAWVIVCTAAVCILGNYVNSIQNTLDSEMPTLSEEITELQRRVHVLEREQEETLSAPTQADDEEAVADNVETVEDASEEDETTDEAETAANEGEDSAAEEDAIGNEDEIYGAGSGYDTAAAQSSFNDNYTRY